MDIIYVENMLSKNAEYDMNVFRKNFILFDKYVMPKSKSHKHRTGMLDFEVKTLLGQSETELSFLHKNKRRAFCPEIFFKIYDYIHFVASYKSHNNTHLTTSKYKINIFEDDINYYAMLCKLYNGFWMFIRVLGGALTEMTCWTKKCEVYASTNILQLITYGMCHRDRLDMSLDMFISFKYDFKYDLKCDENENICHVCKRNTKESIDCIKCHNYICITCFDDINVKERFLMNEKYIKYYYCYLCEAISISDKIEIDITLDFSIKNRIMSEK